MNRIRFFLTLITVTLAFVLYQNFGVIVNQDMVKKLDSKYQPKKHEYDPNRSVKHVEEFYAKNVAFIEPVDEKKYFDHKKFLKDTWKSSPLYGRLKNWVEVSDVDVEDKQRMPANEIESEAENIAVSEDIDVKLDPLKTKAMVRYVGSFKADLAYIQDESSVQVNVSKDLDTNTQLKLQHDSNEEKTWIQYQFNW